MDVVNFPCDPEKKNVFCYCWIKYSTDVLNLHLDDGVVEFSYVFNDFLYSASISDTGVLESSVIIINPQNSNMF
jgi:hypothetical protein